MEFKRINKDTVTCIITEDDMDEQGIKLEDLFEKKKDIVYNQVTLFSRSLYHTFLNRSSIDPMLIQPDVHDLSNGVFAYNKEELIIPTWQNAFTLESYKSVLKNGVIACSNEFPFKDIRMLSVIYLVKDIVGTYQFSDN